MSELNSINLKPGNLIIHRDYPLLPQIIVGIEKYYIKTYFFNDKKELLHEREFNQFLPISLSVNWLRKANYKQLRRVEKTYSLSNFEDNSAIYFTGVRFIHIITGTHLEYVHELQNLHSAINKEELKFT